MQHLAKMIARRIPPPILAGGFSIVIGLLAWLAASFWLGRAAQDDLRREAERVALQQVRLFSSDLAQFRLLPLVLGEYNDLGEALRQGDPAARRRMDAKLHLLAERTGAPVIYLIDRSGETVSASNTGTAESFVGRNYRFRPYFVRAMQQGPAEYYAVGNVSGRPGLFLARRIGPAADPAGVIVVKVEFDSLIRIWRSDPGQTLVMDRRGIVLFATDPAERFRTTRPLTRAELTDIASAAQFGYVPLQPRRYVVTGRGLARMPGGVRSVISAVAMPMPGWRLFHAMPVAAALREAANLARLIGLVAALISGLVAAFLLWRITRAADAARERARLEAAVATRTAELRAEIAERTRVDERFREAREELAQANRLGSLGSITAGLAHEINQPVATIRTLSENARAHLASGRLDRVAANLDTAIGLTARIGAITQEMRRFARRGTGTIEPVPLDAVIAGTRLLIGDRFRTAGVALEWPPPGQSSVIAGRVRLEQVLVNLLQNALDAVKERAEALVALTIEVEDDRVALIVADNGPGIDPAIADHIFEPFVTGKPDGLGLGLGIVRDIIEAFDGTVAVVPSPLGGAAFRMTVARAREVTP
ncbi:ATP-binding protein [uncultured Sphingomonas sp.]|uniref:sensor histidine kinase n=1 Tax=uncultured Sphingomonas sp. TaxID=158754 RepID=UPI0025F1E27A|nr:ATP-binding protein [uncultured Sphingomonas sp.]